MELGPKGERTIRPILLTPLRDMVERRGTFQELFSAPRLPQDQEAYIHVVLTDEEDVPNAMERLRTIYPNVMGLDYDNRRTRSGDFCMGSANMVQQSPLDLFAAFYEQQNGAPLTEEQRRYLTAKIEEIQEVKE